MNVNRSSLSNVGVDLCVRPCAMANAESGADTQVCPYNNHRKIFAPPLTNLRSWRRHSDWRGARRAVSLATLALVCGILYAPSINAQQRRGESQQERLATQSLAPETGNARILAGTEKDYRISAGDVIQIHIEDAPELSHFYRVSSSGSIEMPVLGLVEAQMKTTFELTRMIAKGLREKEYLNTPNVLVTIKQYNSQTFFIQGSVRTPGVYQTEGRPSLLTMISLAGGLSDDHGSTIFILRPDKIKKPGTEADNQISSLQDQIPDSDQPPQTPTSGAASAQAADSDYELIKVNVNALFKGQFDQRLEPGDIVNIPRADVFFVAGEVKAPGSFPLKDGTTLRQAVSLAQGMTFSAKAKRGIIFREDPMLGSRREIKVDISAIMSGKKDDIPVLANDVIIIPNSRTKSVGGMLLTALGVNSARIPIR
jgi:polysaccharide biosynthesis/export protein